MLSRLLVGFSCLLLVPGCKDDGNGGSDDAGTTSETTDTTTGDSTSTSSGEESSGSTTGGSTLPPRVQAIIDALDIAMYECPNRAWPDIEPELRASQVLLASVSDDVAYVWNLQTGEGDPPRVTEGPLSDLSPEWGAPFNVGELGGAPTLGISLDWTQEVNDDIEANGILWIDFAAELSFHEGFHFLSGQSAWPVGGASRTIPYPEPWEPRYLRAELLGALKDLVQDAGGSGLGGAAYWRDRYDTDYPTEAAEVRNTEVTEGSAEYATIIMDALADQSCDATDSELIATAVSHLDDGSQLSTNFNSGSEPYDLGMLSGLLLAEMGPAGWTSSVETGTPPVEILLQGVTPQMQPDDPTLQAEVQTAVDERNVEVGMEIDPMLANMADPSYYRVPINFNWVAGAFGVGGFYYLPDEPGTPDVYLLLDANFVPPSMVTIDLTDLTVLVGVSTPCQIQGAAVLPIPVAEVSYDMGQGLATSTFAGATFTDLEVEETMDMNGLPWLCPVDAGGAPLIPDPGKQMKWPTPTLHRVHAPEGMPQPVVVR